MNCMQIDLCVWGTWRTNLSKKKLHIICNVFFYLYILYTLFVWVIKQHQFFKRTQFCLVRLLAHNTWTSSWGASTRTMRWFLLHWHWSLAIASGLLLRLTCGKPMQPILWGYRFILFIQSCMLCMKLPLSLSGSPGLLLTALILRYLLAVLTKTSLADVPRCLVR